MRWSMRTKRPRAGGLAACSADGAAARATNLAADRLCCGRRAARRGLRSRAHSPPHDAPADRGVRFGVCPAGDAHAAGACNLCRLRRTAAVQPGWAGARCGCLRAAFQPSGTGGIFVFWRRSGPFVPDGSTAFCIFFEKNQKNPCFPLFKGAKMGYDMY